MPRTARLDAPGVLHHVMIRGIERRKIFRNNKDREDFIERLEILCPETEINCYAWAFLPNHAHFLFRTGTVPLSGLMRRLLTGYVIGFNLRHVRSGQLFQNRYKSIKRVSEVLGLKPEEVFSKGRQGRKVEARSLFCFWAARELGIMHTVLAKKLEMGLAGIGLSVERGEGIAKRGQYSLEKQVSEF